MLIPYDQLQPETLHNLMADFLAALRGEIAPMTNARASLESHLLAFAAEEARLQRKVVEMEDFRSRAEALTQRAA